MEGTCIWGRQRTLGGNDTREVFGNGLVMDSTLMIIRFLLLHSK